MSQTLPKVADMEREKYEKVWQNPAYRRVSPGELSVQDFLQWTGGVGEVLDLGCGTGRAAVAIAKHQPVTLVDHASNCRDPEAEHLPFHQLCLWDMMLPITKRFDYGFCCDVMEHIPPSKVDQTLIRIAAHCDSVYFRIYLHKDNGKFSDEPLHLTIRPAEWWLEQVQYNWQDTLMETDPTNDRVVTLKARR